MFTFGLRAATTVEGGTGTTVVSGVLTASVNPVGLTASSDYSVTAEAYDNRTTANNQVSCEAELNSTGLQAQLQ